MHARQPDDSFFDRMLHVLNRGDWFTTPIETSYDLFLENVCLMHRAAQKGWFWKAKTEVEE